MSKSYNPSGNPAPAPSGSFPRGRTPRNPQFNPGRAGGNPDYSRGNERPYGLKTAGPISHFMGSILGQAARGSAAAAYGNAKTQELEEHIDANNRASTAATTQAVAQSTGAIVNAINNQSGSSPDPLHGPALPTARPVTTGRVPGRWKGNGSLGDSTLINGPLPKQAVNTNSSSLPYRADESSGNFKNLLPYVPSSPTLGNSGGTPEAATTPTSYTPSVSTTWHSGNKAINVPGTAGKFVIGSPDSSSGPLGSVSFQRPRLGNNGGSPITGE